MGLVFLTSALAPCCVDSRAWDRVRLTAFSNIFITFIHVYFGTLAARTKEVSEKRGEHHEIIALIFVPVSFGGDYQYISHIF